jgi:O-6-methylguanine DNA methyltransferase
MHDLWLNERVQLNKGIPTDARLGIKPTRSSEERIRGMTGKQSLITAKIDTDGYCSALNLANTFDGTISKHALKNLPDFLAEGLADFFAGTDPTVLRIRCTLRGLTDWQQRAIKALASIPRGKVCSYAQLAAMLGASGASRAAGQACAINPLPLIFPCHRVIHTDGRPGAYMHIPDSPLKQRLLEIEGIELTREGRVPIEYFL